MKTGTPSGLWLTRLAIVVATLPATLMSVAAYAQTAPKFDFAKPEEVKLVQWKAQVKAGALLTSGNSQTKGGTVAGTVSRKAGGNRFAFDAAAAYGQSNNPTSVVGPDPNDPTGMMTPAVLEIGRTSVVSTNNWITKARYDRFFTANNSGYLSAQAAGDKVAGKTFYGGGQIGYSRQLVANAVHTAVAEIGYDFSHERYVQQPMKTIDPITIHSARVFVGDQAKLTSETGATVSLEALFNLNAEDKALNVNTGMPGVEALHDTRVIGKAGLTTTLAKRLSIGFTFTLKYDQNPAALPVPPGTPAGVGFATGFTPFAEKIDTLVEATLIYTFL